jgi:enoyl-CoA hydratase
MTVVIVEQRGPVSVIAINRPEKLNAINKAVAIELQQAFAAFDRSEQRVAILTGLGGRAFSSGAHVTDLPNCGAACRRSGSRPTSRSSPRFPAGASAAGW